MQNVTLVATNPKSELSTSALSGVFRDVFKYSLSPLGVSLELFKNTQIEILRKILAGSVP